MTNMFLAFWNFITKHHESIAMLSVGSIFLTSIILAHFRDMLKRTGRRVYDVKFMPWKMKDKIDSFGYMLAFWYFGNDSLLYNLILTIWRLGLYGMIASVIVFLI